MRFRSSNTTSITQVIATCGQRLLHCIAELRGSEWPSPGKSQAGRRQGGTRTKAGSEAVSQRPFSFQWGAVTSTFSFLSVLQKQWMGVFVISASLVHRVKLPLCGGFYCNQAVEQLLNITRKPRCCPTFVSRRACLCSILSFG